MLDYNYLLFQIAIPTFVHLVTALSNKMVQATFQQAAVYCLDRVKEIVGRNKFDHYLETFHPIIKKVNTVESVRTLKYIHHLSSVKIVEHNIKEARLC